MYTHRYYFESLQEQYQEGEIVALRCLKYQERPQLGMVLQVADDEVTIKWYDGSWSGRWKVYTYKESQNSEPIAWVETLPIGDIITGKIELTKSCSLPKATKEKLRDLYNSLDNTSNYFLLIKSIPLLCTSHDFSLSTSQNIFPFSTYTSFTPDTLNWSQN